MYYVYVLYSTSHKKKYIGFTSDLRKRVSQHKAGNSRYTKKIKDWNLVYYQCFVNKTDALREEKFLKSGKGFDRLKHLLDNTLKNGDVA